MGRIAIRLQDLLMLDDLSNVKIKFNQFNGESHPMDKYIEDPDIVNNSWLFWRAKRRYFKVGEIAICMLQLSSDVWLLTTVKTVTKELGVENGINYEGEELEKFAPYYGRILVKFRKTFQSQVVFVEKIWHELEVLQILPSIYDGEDFPGYDSVRLSYEQLQIIIERNKKDWVSALENQKAVYLITDRNNGKLYVGSATGDNGMLLQRWSNYVSNGHGNNRELMSIVEEKGIDYVKKYFQYSILENYNARVDKQIILSRENWWKKTLYSKIPFGYNAN